MTIATRAIVSRLRSSYMCSTSDMVPSGFFGRLPARRNGIRATVRDLLGGAAARAPLGLGDLRLGRGLGLGERLGLRRGLRVGLLVGRLVGLGRVVVLHALHLALEHAGGLTDGPGHV